MKKEILYLLLIIIAFQSCLPDPDEGYFKIHGQLFNTNGETVFLSKITGTESIPVDSAQIDSTGNFILSGLTYETGLYILHTSPTSRIPFVIDSSEHVIIRGNYTDLFNTCDIEGSQQSKILHDVERKFAITKKAVDSLSVIFKANKSNPALDSVKNELDKSFVNIWNYQKDFSKKIINESPGSFAAYFAITQEFAPKVPVIDPVNDYQLYKKVDSALTKRYGNMAYFQKFHDYVSGLTKARQTKKTISSTLPDGNLAPEISLPDQAGNLFNLSSLKGKYVYVHFWASWSKQARNENQTLNRLYWFYYRKFEILQVSLDFSYQPWKDAIKKDQLKWWHVCDIKGWDSKYAESYGITRLPAGFLISPEGKIIASDLNSIKLETKLKELFPATVAPPTQPTIKKIN